MSVLTAIELKGTLLTASTPKLGTACEGEDQKVAACMLPLDRKLQLLKCLEQDGCEVVDHGTHLTGKIPTISKLVSDEEIGKGVSGTIVSYKKDHSFVIKPLFEAQNEFLIGYQLNHPNINKIYALITSKDKKPYALVMDRVEGVLLESKAFKLTTKELCNLVLQIKECCLYLFEQHIAPYDLNPRNVFILNDKNFKLIDFDAWEKSEALHIVATQILFYSMSIIQDLVKRSDLHEDGSIGFPEGQIKEHSYKQTFVTIVNFFRCRKASRFFDFSQFYPINYLKIVQVLNTYLKGTKEPALRDFIGSYFDRVVQQIKVN